MGLVPNISDKLRDEEGQRVAVPVVKHVSTTRFGKCSRDAVMEHQVWKLFKRCYYGTSHLENVHELLLWNIRFEKF